MIEVRNLRKVFGQKVAVDDLSFTVEKGHILGLIGPNGAGKSTTMKMVTGCLRPTSGTVQLLGKDIHQQPIAAKKHLGYLPESAPSYEDLTVEEFLSYIGSFRGLSGKHSKSALDRVIELCFLQSVRKQSIETLSKGYRHRICLAQSIIHDPEIIVFDEPTDGLDPNQKTEIRRLVEQIRPNKAIILSTHILDEVDALCTDIILIDHGKLIINSNPKSIRLDTNQEIVIEIQVSSGAQRIGVLLTELRSDLTVNVKDEKNIYVNCQFASIEKIELLLRELHQLSLDHAWPLLQMKIVEARLEDIFRHLTFRSPGNKTYV